MDLKVVVREMLKKGTPPEEVKGNLTELGVADPDAIINQVLAEEKAAAKASVVVERPVPRVDRPTPQMEQLVPRVEQKPVEEKPVAAEEKPVDEESSSDLFEMVDSVKQDAKPAKRENNLFGSPRVEEPEKESASSGLFGASKNEELFSNRQDAKKLAEAKTAAKELSRPLIQKPGDDEKPDVEERVGLSVTRVSDEGENEVSLGGLVDEREDLMKRMPSTDFNPDELERKLDETIALLKALKELNKDMLETERKVLLRLK